MVKSKTKKHLLVYSDSLHTIIVWIVGITVAVVPLWSPTYVFIGTSFNKAALFYLLTTVLVSMYLGLIWRDRSYLPKFNLIGWSFWGLVVALAITTITSVQPYLSFWGTFNRTDGWLMWLYYFIFFIITTSVLTKPELWRKVMAISLVGTTIVILYGLGQAVLWPGVVASLDRWRIESTLGNPVFLGGYLALVLPFTLAWTLNSADRRWRYLGGMLAGLEAIALLLTWSRGAWLAALVGIIVLIGGYFYYFRSTGFKRIVIISLVGLGLVMGGLGLGQTLPEKFWLHRATYYFFRVDSLTLRYRTWQIAVDGIYERPVLGWGLENFSVAFDRHYQIFPKRDMPFAEAHNDRPHNEYLGMAINGGYPTALIYLLLLLSAIWLGWRQIAEFAQQNKIRAENIFYWGCLATVVSYLVFALTAFQLVDIILYLLLALAGLNQIRPLAKLQRPVSYPAGLIYFILIVGFGVIVLSYWSTIKPLVAVQWADRATLAFQRQDFQQSQQLFDQALAQNSYLSNPIRGQMVVLASNANVDLADNQVLNDFKRYLAYILSDTYKTEPYNSYYPLIFGMYYGQLARIWPEFLAQANASFEKVVNLAPDKGETYWRWGNVHYLLGDPVTAEKKYAQALAAEPYNWVINYQVGLWYIDQNQLDRGMELIQNAFVSGDGSISLVEIRRVVRIWEDRGYLPQIESFYNVIIDNNPDHPQFNLLKTDLDKFKSELNKNQNSPG